MIIPVKNTNKVLSDGEALMSEPSITEPFTTGRSTPRLLFDFSVMISLLNQAILTYPILDFGAGTGWISEFCARMGFQTVAFDIHGDLQACLERRVSSDKRIDERLLSFSHGDGHNMPFDSDVFGHLLCYDTLHHMHDYSKVFSEFFRVLKPGGRAIFVEPGARHSCSPETIKFLSDQKNSHLNWIERDVVLEEMDKIACNSGFKNGISIVPMSSPVAMQVYSLKEWNNFRNSNSLERLRLTDQLAYFNYWDRIIFYVDKPKL